MSVLDKNTVFVAVAIIFKEYRGRRWWLIAKPKKDSEWELPRIVARKAESSARAAIRMAGEQLGITAKVLEEAGRSGGVTVVGNKTVPQKHLYYLMMHKADAGEALSFYESSWFEYAKAVRKLTSKRDRQMIKAAREELKVWQKKHENDPPEEEEEVSD